MDEMKDVAEEAKNLEGPALKRGEHALGASVAGAGFDPAAAEARLASCWENA